MVQMSAKLCSSTDHPHHYFHWKGGISVFFFLIIIIPLCQTFPAPFFEKNMKSKIVGWGWGRFSSMFIALNRKTSAVLRKKTPFLLLGASYYQC